MREKIFIQIPAYRDSELQPTLYDLIEKATHKKQLRIAIAWQHAEQEKLDYKFLREHRVELNKIPAAKSLGCNWARRGLQESWQGEKYTLFLDSHHRFIPSWDEQTIEMYEGLRSGGFAKPILTSYLPAYDPLNDPEAREKLPLRIIFSKREKGLLFRLGSRPILSWKSMHEPIPSKFTSLHFLFTEGAFNREVKFDPSIYFFADEIAIALRAYTLGYDIFHPHIILGWHLYNRSSTRVPHWIDHPEWMQQNENCYTQLSRLFRGNITGNYGIGFKRTIASYEKYIGMKLIQPGT